MSTTLQENRAVVDFLRAAMYDWTDAEVSARLRAVFDPDAVVQLAHPFNRVGDARDWFEQVLQPLSAALAGLERRDTIVISGPDSLGNDWVGCCGHYTGAWVAPFLGIPPSRRQAAMRFHEFFRLVDGRIVEMQALWDLPELMMQSGVWPMGPSLGREWHVPGPATQDGTAQPYSDGAEASRDLVLAMLTDMGKHPTEPAEAMNLETYWHPRMSWYGPAGIGTSRAIAGFRQGHQIPFLAAMPDRRGGTGANVSHFFAQGDYVGVTAWPGMEMTLTGGGWLGIAPAGRAITMRSLDFWRVEGGLIRENWVLVDLLHVWHQLGVDVLARMAELVDGPVYDGA